MSRNIGLLIPRSVLYPTVNFDLVGGFRYGLADMGVNDVAIKTENIAIGADDKLIYAACEKLLFDGCDIIAGYINPGSAEKLASLFANANAIFILLDAGYLYPASMNSQPHIFTLSLQGALCSRIVAKTAMEEGMKNFALTCSFYDSGYRSMHAYARLLEEESGAVTLNHITALKRADFTLASLAAHLQHDKPDAVLATFCGDMMQDFFAAAASSNIFEIHPVYGSAFMGDEQWLAQCPYPGVDIKTCVTWASRLDNEANVHYKQIMEEKKQRVNLFSLLGWEAAQLAAAAINAGDTEAAIAALEGMVYNSPRGEIKVDAASHQSYAPVYVAWVEKDGETGNCILAPEGESPFTADQRTKLEYDINNFTGGATSWFNAYACLES